MAIAMSARVSCSSLQGPLAAAHCQWLAVVVMMMMMAD